jgi:WD40 repeat protein/predicted Ser/Thr protein kinase
MVDTDLDSNVHPDADKLQGFGQGLLAPDDAATVEEHLAGCDACCRQLEATPNDSFIGELREAQKLSLPGTQAFAAGYSLPVEESVSDLADNPRYRVIRLLGRGGMGAVYLAEHRRMGRLVALKIINPHLLNHASALMRFQQEVKTAAKLDHANIVAAYDADQAGSLHFLVMEYVEGQNLADHLAEAGPLPMARACDIIRQAALGLQHAHERGMVHRDIKPHNLMLTPSGQVKVLDFGLARFALEPDNTAITEQAATPGGLTGAGAVMGTADYIAPEQARDAHLADGRSDIYSLGCTLYHLLTGQPPFPKGTAREKLQRHSANVPLWLRDVRPEVPMELARVVAKMMAKKPEDRFQTAAEVAAALKPHCGIAGSKRAKVRRALFAGAVLVMAVAMAGVVWMFRPATDHRDPNDGANQVRDEATAAKVGEIRRWERHDRWYVHRVLVAPDGQSAWSVGRTDFRRWNVATGLKVREKITPDWIEEIALSPDGKQILAADGWTGSIRIVDADTLDEIRSFRLGPGKMRYWQAAWFPDGKQILTGGHDAIVRIWDVEKGKPVREFKGHEPAVGCVGISGDGTKILTGNDMSSLLKVWNIQTGEVICSFADQACQPNSAKFVLKDKAILSCGSDGAIRLFDSQTGRELRGFTVLDKATKFERIALFREGRHFVAAGSDGHLAVWKLDTGIEIYKVGTREPICALAITADDRDLLLGTVKGEIIQWRLPTPPAVEKVGEVRRFGGGQGMIGRVHFLPGGDRALSSGPLVSLWNVRTGDKIRDLDACYWSTSVSCDGRYALTGTQLWDLETGEKLRNLDQGIPQFLWGADFSPDGERAVLGGPKAPQADGRTLWVAEVRTGKLLRQFGKGERVRSVAYSPKGTQIAAGHSDTADTEPSFIRVYDVETGEVLRKFDIPTGAGRLTFSPNGKQLLSANSAAIRLWDLTTGQQLRQFEGHTGAVEWVTFTPDGRRILSAGGEGDSTLRIWDATTAKELQCFRGHRLGVLGVAVSPDGGYALSGSVEGVLRLWRLPEPPAAEMIGGK